MWLLGGEKGLIVWCVHSSVQY